MSAAHLSIASLHPPALFANLARTSRATRKGPATEQETVPGAADKHPDVQKAFRFLKLPSLRRALGHHR